MSELFHPTPSLAHLQFIHWLNRKSQIISIRQPDCPACGVQGISGIWQGNLHPKPILLHKLIDDQLDRLRPLAWLDFVTRGFRVEELPIKL